MPDTCLMAAQARDVDHAAGPSEAAGPLEATASATGPLPVPRADVVISPDLVRRLLAEQMPDLTHRRLTEAAAGWDNVTFRLGADLAVRLPRRVAAARLHDNEVSWLPEIETPLTIAVPSIVAVGHASDAYPYTWSVRRWIDGAPADATLLAHDADQAMRLAGFLRRLHHPAPPQAPRNPVRGVPLAERTASVETFAAQAAEVVDTGAALSVWSRSLAWPAHQEAPTWVHGDLHPHNVIVAQGRIAGIVDFGDITAGDPAVDWAIGWMLFDGPARRILFDGLDADMIGRARGWAALLALALAAHSQGRPDMADLARVTLARLTEEQSPR